MSEWWRGGVIYQIYPRSYQDSTGNGIGDLPGIISRLDYIADLGVDAIWLSPIFTSPMADMGYDVSNYTDVDPLFGHLADFDRLVENAHALGLKIIIDQVISHTSNQHPWFQQSKLSRDNERADWYVWVDPKEDGTAPNNWASVFGGSAWAWNPTRRQYYLHNFLTEQPDLNFHNPEVQNQMLDVLRFWLERGVDGFRFDTVNFYFHDQELRSNPALKREENLPEVNPYEMQFHEFSKNRPENVAYLERIRTLLNEFGATSVGEVGDSQRAVELMAEYTAGGERLHMAYSFDMLGPEFTPKHFRSRLEEFEAAAPDGWPCWSFSNHDVQRHVTRWVEHGASLEAVARQTAMLLLTLRGSVCLYQGEELGLPEADILFEELTDPPGINFWPEYKGRDGCRTPMPWSEGGAPNGFSHGTPWLPVKEPHSARNVEHQLADDTSVLAYYREALAFRKENAALIDGNIMFIDLVGPVLAFIRYKGEQTFLCVFNLSAQAQKLALQNQEGVTLQSVSRGASVGDDLLELAASGFAIFEQREGEAVALTEAG